jgi:hypothetical protein
MLYPVPELYAGALFFPIERTAEVLHTWRQWTDTVPDAVTSIGRILRLPSLPEIPEFLRGRAWAMVEAACLGGAVVGAELIRPLRALGPELDTFATIPAPGLQRLHMDPEQPVPAECDGALLADLPAGAFDALVALAGPDADTPLLSIDIRHLAGALARQAPGGGALAKIDGTYAVFATGFTRRPCWATRSAPTLEPSRTRSACGAPTMTTTATSSRVRPRQRSHSRTPRTSACQRSRPGTIPTR